MSKHKKTTSHNYIKKLSKLIDDGETIFLTQINNLEIQHDDWCDKINQKDGFCNCKPIIKIRDKI